MYVTRQWQVQMANGVSRRKAAAPRRYGNNNVDVAGAPPSRHGTNVTLIGYNAITGKAKAWVTVAAVRHAQTSPVTPPSRARNKIHHHHH